MATSSVWAIGAGLVSLSLSFVVGSAQAQETPTGVPPGLMILWDQMDFPAAANGVRSSVHVFEPARDSESADDFIVPPSASWTIDRITIWGTYVNHTGPSPKVAITFYKDPAPFAAVPGEPIYTVTGLTPMDLNGTFITDLQIPLQLTAGHYWVSVVVIQGVGFDGDWGWKERTVLNGLPSAWRNPGNFYLTGCTEWAQRQSTCHVGVAPDLLFRLEGEAVTPPVPPLFSDGFEGSPPGS
jgi:hypothetical protein